MMAKKGLKSNKGFTLVELIVVLVILAILAAILVPALLGYIDRAKGQQIVLNAKSALTAAQAEFSSMYAKDADPTDTDNMTETVKKRILDTADVPCSEFIVYVNAADGDHGPYKILQASYTEGGQTIIFDGKSWDEGNEVDSSYDAVSIK